MSSDPDPAARLATFNAYRGLLFSIAYRMLGTATDAEDMLQETFIRWQLSGESDIHSPRAFLVTIISRLCIHQLEAARTTREAYIGPWLPEPIHTDPSSDPQAEAETHDSISMAFLVLLEQLTPLERATFLLRDVFDYDYSEVAAIVGKSEAACRQILHRARQHVAEHRPRFQASAEHHAELLKGFVSASTTGNLEQLVSLLADDVVLYADGGGKRAAASRPVLGAAHVAQFLLSAAKRSVPEDVSIRIERVNGEPGVVYRFPSGQAGCVITVETSENRIRRVYVVTNPDKLLRLATSGIPAET